MVYVLVRFQVERRWMGLLYLKSDGSVHHAKSKPIEKNATHNTTLGSESPRVLTHRTDIMQEKYGRVNRSALGVKGLCGLVD